MGKQMDAARVVARLGEEFGRAVEALHDGLKAFIRRGAPPDPELRAAGAFTYPELRIAYLGARPPPRLARSYARFSQPGVYAVTITRPDLFGDYLTEQLSLLMEDFDVDVEVGRSEQEIPFPYVLDAADAPAADVSAAVIARYFPATELAQIGDEVSDGFWTAPPGAVRPLALFDALRTDFSLARITHYTGTLAEHAQAYLLFTNYHRYVDEFVRFACAELKREGSPYEALSCAGGLVLTRETADPDRAIADGAWRRHQMPAYHLMAPGRCGLSLINIGVGPSNA